MKNQGSKPTPAAATVRIWSSNNLPPTPEDSLCLQTRLISFKTPFFSLSFFSSFVVHAACDRHQLWRSNQCFICLHLYICSQRSPLILKVQHLLKTGNWFYTVIPTTNPYWSELSPSNTECLYLLVGLLILLSKFFGLGVTQTPSTGLRHPSFNHCHI